jgi:prepilin-type N-terminal cleavage/methylation domain-containing protein
LGVFVWGNKKEIFNKMKKAFTLIEMIFAMVILAIIGVISSDIIYRVYENYMIQKKVSSLELETKIVLDQIVKYLENSIKPSIARYDGSNYEAIADTSKFDANTSSNDSGYFVWIAKDIESLRGIWNDDKKRVYPAYSSVINVEKSSDKNIVTVDDNLSQIKSIVGAIINLNENDVFSNHIEALYFVYANSSGTVQERFWQNPSSLFVVDSVSDKNITLNKKPDEISDKFYLTYTAYGLQFDSEHSDHNLTLFWNFRPWNNKTVNDGNTSVLIQNVTEFKMWSEGGGGVIRIKLCITDDNNITTFCKEAVALR